jgi:type I restriction enzyme S subunit
MTKPVGKNGELVPKLRFPGFRGGLGWECEPMGEVYSFKGNNSLSREKLNYEHGSVRNIHYGDIHSKYSALFDITKERVPFINPIEDLEGYKAENYCLEGDMIFADASEDLGDIGKCIEIIRINEERVVSGLHTILARQIIARLEVGFGGHLFKSKWVRAQIQNEAQGTKVLGLSAGRFAKVKITFPSSKAEQRKIANCLGLLDDLIEAEHQRLDALKVHKKGLIEQIFPREAEAVPRLRFLEFRSASEWDTRKLATFVAERNQPSGGELPLFSLTIEDGVTPKTERYERSFLVKDEEDAYKAVLPNDFVLNPMNLRFGAIGRRAGATGVAVSKYYNVFYCDRTVEPRFFEILLRSDRMIAFYDKMAAGSLVEKKRIHFKDFLGFEFRLPLLPEQNTIADCLCSLNDLISSQCDKVATLQTYKKGLMQQLFPSLVKIEP